MENILEQSISLQNLLTNPWIIVVLGLVVWYVGGRVWGSHLLVKWVKQGKTIVPPCHWQRGYRGFYYSHRIFFPLSMIFYVIVTSIENMIDRSYKNVDNIVSKVKDKG